MFSKKIDLYQELIKFKKNALSEHIKELSGMESGYAEAQHLIYESSNKETLRRAGFSKVIEMGKHTLKNYRQKQSALYGLQIEEENHIIDISEINRLAARYNLIIASTKEYGASFSGEVIDQLASFTHTILPKFPSKEPWFGTEKEEESFFIVSKTDVLQGSSNKQTLLFYKINKEKNYLVAHWGTDIIASSLSPKLTKILTWIANVINFIVAAPMAFYYYPHWWWYQVAVGLYGCSLLIKACRELGATVETPDDLINFYY